MYGGITNRAACMTGMVQGRDRPTGECVEVPEVRN